MEWSWFTVFKAFATGCIIAIFIEVYKAHKEKKKKQEEKANQAKYEPVLTWDPYMQRLQIRILVRKEYTEEIMSSPIQPIVVDSVAYSTMADTILSSLKWAYDNTERAIQDMTSGWWWGLVSTKRAKEEFAKRKTK